MRDPSALERARNLKLMAFDVDGVMTDGTLYLSDGGEETKGFSVLDGLGLKLLREAGLTLAIITGRVSRLVELRAQDLGIARLHQGVQDKLHVFEALRTELRLQPAECGYMGDDLPDLRILVRCGFAATVPAAPLPVRERAHYVAGAQAGHGAVREVCDFILHAQGRLERIIGRHLA